MSASVAWGQPQRQTYITDLASSQYDILWCSETLVSDMRHVWELLVPGFGRPVLTGPRARGLAAYEIVSEHFANRNLSVVVWKYCFLRFVVWSRFFFYVLTLYRNPHLNDQILDCLLASMTAVQAEDVRASTVYGWLKGHHQEWLDSTTTNCHGVTAFDFATVFTLQLWSVGCRPNPCSWWKTWPPDDWCSWPITGCCCCTDKQLRSLLSVGSHFGGPGVPTLYASRKVFLKPQVNWNTVCGAIQDLPWRNILLADNPVVVINEHLSLLAVRYVAIKVIRVLNKDKPWFDDQCRRAFGLKHGAHIRLACDRSRINWEEYVRCQMRAETYLEEKRQISDRNKDVLIKMY